VVAVPGVETVEQLRCYHSTTEQSPELFCCVLRAKHEQDVHHHHTADDHHHLRPDHSDENIRQSPSIRLLESRFVYGEAHQDSGGHGISDF